MVYSDSKVRKFFNKIIWRIFAAQIEEVKKHPEALADDSKEKVTI